MNKIKWGIIGSGGIARMRTIPGMMMAENAECAAIMDINEESLKETQKEFGIKKAYTSVDELLAQNDIDAVYIATPVFCHKEQVFKAAEAGKHILLEKPMGLTCDEANEIIDFCKEKNVKLGVGFMMRFHGAHQEVKKIIDSGTLGQIVTCYAKFNDWVPTSNKDWHQTKAFSGGGTMMDMGIHCIDLLQYLTGLKTKSLTAMCVNSIFEYPDTEDGATAIMKMDNGALMCIESNFNIPENAGGCKFEIYGTKGSITAVGTIGQTETGTVQLITTDTPEIISRDIPYTSGNMYTKEIEGFSNAILKNSPVPVTAEEGLFNQKIVECIYESQEKNAHIEL